MMYGAVRKFCQSRLHKTVSIAIFLEKTERRQNNKSILRALASFKKEEQRQLLTTAVIHTYAVDIKTKLNLIYVCKGALRIVSRLHRLLT